MSGGNRGKMIAGQVMRGGASVDIVELKGDFPTGCWVLKKEINL